MLKTGNAKIKDEDNALKTFTSILEYRLLGTSIKKGVDPVPS